MFKMLPPKLPPKIGIRKFIRRYFDLLKTTKKPLFTGFVKVELTVYKTQRAVMKGSKKSLSLRQIAQMGTLRVPIFSI